MIWRAHLPAGYPGRQNSAISDGAGEPGSYWILNRLAIPLWPIDTRIWAMTGIPFRESRQTRKQITFRYRTPTIQGAR